MNPRQLSRGITSIFFGLFIATVIHHHNVYWSQRGFDAFIVHETAQFYLRPNPLIMVILGVMIGLVILWLYEAIVWLVEKFWKSPRAT
jgi:hypothetical protein